MSEKSIEDQFNQALEEYILGRTDYSSKKSNQQKMQTSSEEYEEYEELLSIGKALWDEEVCKDINEDKLRHRFMKQIEEEKEKENMKKGKSLKKIIIAASMVAVLGVGMTQTAFGQSIINSVIARFSTGHANVLQYDEEQMEAEKQARIEERKNEPMPKEYVGKIFDKDGKEFTYFPAYLKGAYNAKGEPIMCAKDGEVYTEEEWNKKCEEEMAEEAYTEITDPIKMSDYTCFEVEMPTYLPEGIHFRNAGVWSEASYTENLIIEINFQDESGKDVIYMQQRFACEEAAFESGTTDKVQEVDINGVKGLMHDNSLIWETEEVIYSIHTFDENITRDEVLKIARSFDKVSK